MEKMEPFQRQVSLFIELSTLIEKKCINHKSSFINGKHNELVNHFSNKSFGVIYYNDNHKHWAIQVSGVHYKDYKKSIEIKLNDFSLAHVTRAVEILRDYHDNFDDVFRGKRRTLNFNK